MRVAERMDAQISGTGSRRRLACLGCRPARKSRVRVSGDRFDVRCIGCFRSGRAKGVLGERGVRRPVYRSYAIV